MSNVGLSREIISSITTQARGAKRFTSKIFCNGEVNYIGVFYTAEEAHLAYMEAARRLGVEVKNGGKSDRRASGFLGVDKIAEYKSKRPKTGKFSTMDRSSMIRVVESDTGVTVKPFHLPHDWRKKNKRTKPRSDNVSGLKGALQSGTGKWMSRIWTGARYKYLGYFHSAEDAHEAYAKACSTLNGECYTDKKLYPLDKGGAFVYVIKYEEKYFKIGKSNDPIERLATVATCLPLSPQLLVAIYSSDPINLERNLHRKFSSKRVNGEWFNLDESDIQFLMELSASSK